MGPKGDLGDVALEPTLGFVNNTGGVLPPGTLAVDPQEGMYPGEVPNLEIKTPIVQKSEVSDIPYIDQPNFIETVKEPPAEVGDLTPFCDQGLRVPPPPVETIVGDVAVGSVAVSEDPPVLEVETGKPEDEDPDQAGPKEVVSADYIPEGIHVPPGTDPRILYVEEDGEVIDLWVESPVNTTR